MYDQQKNIIIRILRVRIIFIFLFFEIFACVYSQIILLITQVAVCSQINTKHTNAVWAKSTDVEC